MGVYRAADSSDILLRAAPRSLLLLFLPVVLDPFHHVNDVVEVCGAPCQLDAGIRGKDMAELSPSII